MTVVSLSKTALPNSNPENKKGVKSRGTPTPANTKIEKINFFTNNQKLFAIPDAAIHIGTSHRIVHTQAVFSNIFC